MLLLGISSGDRPAELRHRLRRYYYCRRGHRQRLVEERRRRGELGESDDWRRQFHPRRPTKSTHNLRAGLRIVVQEHGRRPDIRRYADGKLLGIRDRSARVRYALLRWRRRYA